MNDSARQQSWTNFWKQGQLHSLATSMPGNYHGTTAQFWQQQFAPLTTGQAVLDIGTGNGPLPAMLWQMHKGRMPQVDAVDLADIAPPWFRQLSEEDRSQLHFHGNTLAESLPFQDASFDLCISQYGFEYTHLDASIAELARVLKPGGRLAMVLHHAQSRLVEVAQEELHHSAWLQSPEAPLAAASTVLPYLQMAAQGRTAELVNNPAANAARSTLNRSMQALMTHAAQNPYPDLLQDSAEFIAGLLNATGSGAVSADSALTQLQHYQAALSETAMRHRELCACALSEEGTARLQALLAEQGFVDTRTELLKEGEYLLGLTLTATKLG